MTLPENFVSPPVTTLPITARLPVSTVSSETEVEYIMPTILPLPLPEISPEEAKQGGTVVFATGRSDYPNQINNSLAFPGVFRGALDNRVTKITDDMKINAAKAIARIVKRPTPNRVIPDMFDKRVPKAVAKVIR